MRRRRREGDNSEVTEYADALNLYRLSLAFGASTHTAVSTRKRSGELARGDQGVERHEAGREESVSLTGRCR
jgi:hypothetical protein